MKQFLSLIFLVACTSVFAAEDSLYNFAWLDKDKSVYVLQNRQYRKDGSVYIGGAFGLTASGTFTDGTAMQGRAGYFFTETLGIELVMSQNTFKPNSTFDNINTAGVSAFYNYPVQYSGGMLMWSPFYSKINTFDSIIYLDWIFGIGYASITTEDNRIDAQASTDNRQYTTDSATGILLNIGMRIYLSKSWSARIDLTPLIYSGFYRTPGTGNDETQSYKHYDLTFGFNYAF